MTKQFESELIKFAVEARKKAYCPYSNFAVGASVLTSDGKIFCGANIENASYGLTVCAERVAIYNAVSQGSNEFVALCVVTENGDVFPCGACRQVFAEFADDNAEIIIADSKLIHIERTTLSKLLPKAFRIAK